MPGYWGNLELSYTSPPVQDFYRGLNSDGAIRETDREQLFGGESRLTRCDELIINSFAIALNFFFEIFHLAIFKF